MRSSRISTFRAGMLVASLAALCFGPACFAQKPTEEKQRTAPEQVLVLIKSVVKRGDDLVADAVVQEVQRSQAGLKAGDPIRLFYRHQVTNPHYSGPRAPPGPVPAVDPGRQYYAYLEKRGAVYMPVAETHSFVLASGRPSAPAGRLDKPKAY
jgi:hypothetical protein